MKMNPRQYTEKLGLSEQMGHVVNLSGKLYVTVAGLRVLAQRAGVVSIVCQPVNEWCDPEKGVFYFRCEVVMPGDRLFVEYGSSAGSPVGKRGGNHALLGHACTRATGRALRLALEIELPLFEESGLSRPANGPKRAETTQARPDTRSKPEIDYFDYYAKQIKLANDSERLDQIGRDIKANRSVDKQTRDALREVFNARHRERMAAAAEAEEKEKAKLLKAYFAKLRESGFDKAASDGAIKTKIGASSHKEIHPVSLRRMIDALQPYKGPALSSVPKQSDPFVNHLEYARAFAGDA
jgi:hypothetical protein